MNRLAPRLLVAAVPLAAAGAFFRPALFAVVLAAAALGWWLRGKGIAK